MYAHLIRKMQILQTLFTLFSASRMSNSNSPIKYKSTFLSKDLETVLIKDLETVLLQQEFQQGGVKKYQVPKYTGQEEGLEAIIHCNNRFDRAAEKLSWDSEDHFDNYFLRTKLSIIGSIHLDHCIQIQSIELKKLFKKLWEFW